MLLTYTHFDIDTVNYRDLLNRFIKKSFFSSSLCVTRFIPINYLDDYGFLLFAHSFIRLNGTRVLRTQFSYPQRRAINVRADTGKHITGARLRHQMAAVFFPWKTATTERREQTQVTKSKLQCWYIRHWTKEQLIRRTDVVSGTVNCFFQAIYFRH